MDQKRKRLATADISESVSIASTSCDQAFTAAAAEELPHETEEVGPNVVVEEDDYLCTSFCDFLIHLSSKRYATEDFGFQIMVEYALEQCEPNHCDDNEDVYLIELRGLFDWQIGFILMSKLCYFSRTSIKYLHFIVGCRAHGIGKGYLRNMVCSLLDTDRTIKYDLSLHVSIVSVEIDKERDYSSVPWCSTEYQQPQIFAEHSQENEAVSTFSMEVDKTSSERNEKGVPTGSSYPMGTINSEPGFTFDGNKDDDRQSVAASAGSYLDQVSPLNAQQNVVDSSDDVFLCTVVCDFLAGREKPFGDCWKRIYPKVLDGLEKSCSGFCNEDVGSCTVDLRGRFADEAKIMLIGQLNCRPSPRYLDVVVGCKLHGIGDGNLKKIVCELLELNQLMDSFTCKGSIITIQLDGRLDDLPLTWISQPLPDVFEDSDDFELSGSAATLRLEEFVKARGDILSDIYKSSKEEKSLCTFVCDFLSDLPTPPGQWWDKKMTGKVLAGLGKCCTSSSVDQDVEGTVSVDIRGQYVDEAIKDIWSNLYSQQAQKYLNLIVGCKEHGIGKGTLKNAITDVLVSLGIKCVPNTEAFVISIEVGSVNMLLIEKMMSGRKVPLPRAIGIQSLDQSELSEVFLCAILCDLLFDIPEQLLDQRWDVKLVVKVLRALESCDTYFCTEEDFEEGTYAIDLRGEPAHVSEGEFINNLIRWSSYFKKLNFIVGCTRHGVGEGKLRDMIIQVLNRDTTIKWGLVRQAIISVELDPEKDYYLLRSHLPLNRWPPS